MYVNKSFSIDNIDNMNVANLKKLLTAAPDSATVRVSTHKGDRNLMDYHSMTVSWREEVK